MYVLQKIHVFDIWLESSKCGRMTHTTTLPARRLGPLESSALGYGCMGLSQGYGPTSPDEGRSAIHAALGAGITLFDTAMSYGQGDNERLLGDTLRAAGTDGDTALVATKLGITRSGDGVVLDADPSRIRDYALASLARLQREVIDLYYLHRVDPRFPVEDQIGALAELVDEGLVRAVGVSEVTAAQLRLACSVTRISALQLEWSLAWREPEVEIVPVARELGVALVPYSPLGRGLLTDSGDSRNPKTAPFRAGDPRFNESHHEGNVAASQALTTLAHQLGVVPSQLALAWLLHCGDDVVPIPGSRRSDRIRDNAYAANLHLDAGAMGALDRIADRYVGDRHSFAVPTTRRTP